MNKSSFSSTSVDLSSLDLMSIPKSEINMVAELLVDPTVGQQQQQQLPPGIPPMATMAGAVTTGNYEISFMTNGSSGDATPGEATPTPAVPSPLPPRMLGKHARTSSESGLMLRTPAPWPAPDPLVRAVHRRIEVQADGTEAKVQAIILQQKHDHEFMTQLRDAVQGIHERVLNHESGIARWKKWSEDTAKKNLEMEHRVHQDSIGRVQQMRELMEKEFHERFPVELDRVLSPIIALRMETLQKDLALLEEAPLSDVSGLSMWPWPSSGSLSAPKGFSER